MSYSKLIILDMCIFVIRIKKNNKSKPCALAEPVPANIYLFKVYNRSTRTRCEICSELTIKTPEKRHWRRSSVFNINFEHLSHLVLVFLLLTLNISLPVGSILKIYFLSFLIMLLYSFHDNNLLLLSHFLSFDGFHLFDHCK